MNNRPNEPWITAGARVQLSSNTGTIISKTVANIEGREMILGITVEPDNLGKERLSMPHVFPFSPWDISQLKTA